MSSDKLNKSLENYQLKEFVDLLIDTGYLTRMNYKIMIPNEEMMLFYSEITIKILKQKFKEIQ